MSLTATACSTGDTLWDSWFTLAHSYVHGGSLRQTGRSRYRQWMAHKLSTWIDQLGTSSCVGCGRCITWCPMAIDITAEAAAIRATACARTAMPAIEELLGKAPALRPLAPEHRDTLAGCARNRSSSPTRGSCARAIPRTPST